MGDTLVGPWRDTFSRSWDISDSRIAALFRDRWPQLIHLQPAISSWDLAALKRRLVTRGTPFVDVDAFYDRVSSDAPAWYKESEADWTANAFALQQGGFEVAFTHHFSVCDTWLRMGNGVITVGDRTHSGFYAVRSLGDLEPLLGQALLTAFKASDATGPAEQMTRARSGAHVRTAVMAWAERNKVHLTMVGSRGETTSLQHHFPNLKVTHYNVGHKTPDDVMLPSTFPKPSNRRFPVDVDSTIDEFPPDAIWWKDEKTRVQVEQANFVRRGEYYRRHWNAVVFQPHVIQDGKRVADALVIPSVKEHQARLSSRERRPNIQDWDLVLAHRKELTAEAKAEGVPIFDTLDEAWSYVQTLPDREHAFVIAGPSGIGKTTFIDNVRESSPDLPGKYSDLFVPFMTSGYSIFTDDERARAVVSGWRGGLDRLTDDPMKAACVYTSDGSIADKAIAGGANCVILDVDSGALVDSRAYCLVSGPLGNDSPSGRMWYYYHVDHRGRDFSKLASIVYGVWSHPLANDVRSVIATLSVHSGDALVARPPPRPNMFVGLWSISNTLNPTFAKFERNMRSAYTYYLVNYPYGPYLKRITSYQTSVLDGVLTSDYGTETYLDWIYEPEWQRDWVFDTYSLVWNLNMVRPRGVGSKTEFHSFSDGACISDYLSSWIYLTNISFDLGYRQGNQLQLYNTSMTHVVKGLTRIIRHDTGLQKNHEIRLEAMRRWGVEMIFDHPRVNGLTRVPIPLLGIEKRNFHRGMFAITLSGHLLNLLLYAEYAPIDFQRWFGTVRETERILAGSQSREYGRAARQAHLHEVQQDGRLRRWHGYAEYLLSLEAYTLLCEYRGVQVPRDLIELVRKQITSIYSAYPNFGRMGFQSIEYVKELPLPASSGSG